MAVSIRQVKDLKSMLNYFVEKLNWHIDLDSFYDIDDITYGFDAGDVGLKDEEFSKIISLRQLRPLVDNQAWGIFAIEFDSKRFEVSALRKILSGLVPKRRNAEHAMWDKKNLLFLCFWGAEENRTVGVAYFEDKESGLPQIKTTYCSTKIEDVTQLEKFESKLSKLSWPYDPTDHEAWRIHWVQAFTSAYMQVIRDSAVLTEELAEKAKNIKQQILDVLHVETTNGYVHILYEKFKEALIHDMSKDQFADMYAQTMAYGLFSARCMDTKDFFDPHEAIERIPNTNPFLKKLMKECFAVKTGKLSFDELELSDVVELLNNTDTDTILADFNRQTGGGKEDPVIYFYEGFLDAYESLQKKRRGVYYTPQPAVNFIVRAVDYILREEFNYEDGLASTESRRINNLRESKKKINGMIRMVDGIEEIPAIQILDPATGTGTFLRQVILMIWENFKAKHNGKVEGEIRKLWNEYVPKHLLTRLNGFELMMAPYAVAHMKLAMVLKETGYDFSGDERVNVFLTNSLEEAGNSEMQIKLWEDSIATESREANDVKKNKGINVVIGNPPYSGESANKGSWIMSLMQDYKKEPGGTQKLNERNPKWINDDYVKFIRYAQTYIERSGAGIIAYINPHGFIDNPTFRGMRWNLLQTFDKIYILDLHGNSNRKEKCPDGSKDENVFDIQQGVSINIFIKYGGTKAKKNCTVKHGDIWGTRESKYANLTEKSLSKIEFTDVNCSAPEFFFNVTDIDLKKKYDLGFSVNELFPLSSVGVVTANDQILINSTPLELCKNVSNFYTIKANPKLVKKISYRPFDNKFIYYDVSLLERGREQVMKHFFYPNLGLITARSNKSNSCDHFYVSRNISEAKCGERTTQSAIFPLYTYEKLIGKVKRRLNFDKKILHKICDSIGLTPIARKANDAIDCLSPNDIFNYIYAVLYSPKYRETYKSFLKNDFPRVPYPTNKDLFWNLVELGGRLVKLHLLEEPELDSSITEFPVSGNNIVEKVRYNEKKVFINNTQFFCDVSRSSWELYIGGYQPAEKWLKDRKGRVLSEEDILYYQNIIATLTETDRIMTEIDEIISF